MMTNGRAIKQTSWQARCVAVLAVLTCLPWGASWADDEAVAEPARPAAETEAAAGERATARFDVLLRGVDAPRGKRGRPVSITLTFEDGSTQKVDIWQHDRVTIDAVRQQVVIQSGPNQTAAVISATAGHPGLPAGHPPIPPGPAVAIAAPAPVRAPLGVAAPGIPPSAGPPVSADLAPASPPRRPTAKIEDVVVELEMDLDTVEKDEPGPVDQRRLDRLEKMLRHLEDELRSLKGQKGDGAGAANPVERPSTELR